MVGLIIGILVLALPIAIAAFVRALRLERPKKTVLAIFSLVAMALAVVAFVGVLSPALSKKFVEIFFLISLGVGVITLAFAVHFLRKLHNKVFTDKAKEHRESVKRALEEQKDQE